MLKSAYLARIKMEESYGRNHTIIEGKDPLYVRVLPELLGDLIPSGIGDHMGYTHIKIWI